MTENTNPSRQVLQTAADIHHVADRGRYYPQDVYTPTETGEIPVLPMTAKDEMAFKTPDALINGQSTVDVIRAVCQTSRIRGRCQLRHRLDTVGHQDSHIWRDYGYVFTVPGTDEKVHHGEPAGVAGDIPRCK